MKITKSKLKQLIKEELQNVLHEQNFDDIEDELGIGDDDFAKAKPAPMPQVKPQKGTKPAPMPQEKPQEGPKPAPMPAPTKVIMYQGKHPAVELRGKRQHHKSVATSILSKYIRKNMPKADVKGMMLSKDGKYMVAYLR